MIEMRIEGLAELRANLLKLPKDIQGRPLRSAVSAAAKVVQDRAKQLAPEKTGRLKRAIYRTRSRSESSRVQETHIVGVRAGKRHQKKNRDAYYWRFLEFGTSHQRARPYMRPAFDSTRQQQLETLRDRLAKAIARAAAKLKVTRRRGARG